MRGLQELSAAFEVQTRANDFARLVVARVLSQNSGPAAALEIFEKRFPNARNLALIRKGAADAGSTGGWGAGLAPVMPLSGAILELARAAAILPRLPGVRRVPENIAIPRETARPVVSWVGQAKPIPVSALAFETVNLPVFGLAGIVVVTRELIRSADPNAIPVIARALTASVAALMDRAAFDPALAAVPDQNPASLTFGAPSVASTGVTGAAAEADVQSLLALIATEKNNLVLLMRPSTALAWAALRTAGGQAVFPALGINGGSIMGVTVLVSSSVPGGTTGSPPVLSNNVIALDASELVVAEGELAVDPAEHASLEMSDTPADPAAAGVIIDSLWQRNMVGLRVVVGVNWSARAGSVAVLTGVAA